ncbi:MAG TPA: hypothetical protein VGN08_13735 [Solirubrobacteraceae bacterium]|jgi:UDP-N-acetylmuramyl pentapeptide phosphotransferase/UDP-N-acetylglucosamine-1-phosphate transferase
MHALPSLIALVAAAALAPATLRALRAAGHTKLNYRSRPLPCPFGVLALAAALVALIPLTLIARLGSTSVFEPPQLTVAVYALGVLALGLVDDTLAPGEPPEGAAPAPRGLRGHAGAAVRGELSTGLLKAAGSLGLALFAMSQLALSNGRWLLAAAVLVLATNAFNLLDLRPGRSLKAFVLLGAGLTIGSADLHPLWALGLFAAPAVLAGVYDLRERAMLGDTGANLLGALAGLWLVLTLSDTGQIVALALLALLTLYGELRSISRLVERVPVLRRLDSWGRPS